MCNNLVMQIFALIITYNDDDDPRVHDTMLLQVRLGWTARAGRGVSLVHRVGAFTGHLAGCSLALQRGKRFTLVCG